MEPMQTRALPHALLLALSGVSTSVLAQESITTPASPQACFALETDAARLACYDSALGRNPTDTRAADAAAAAGERDAAAERRADFAGAVVRAGRDADDQLRACQAVVAADRAGAN